MKSVLEAYHHEHYQTNTAISLPLLQRAIDDGPYTDAVETELTAFGTVFGDLLGDALHMQWICYTDEEGTDLALRYGGSTIVSFPRSMIIKRIENDEEIDLQHLFNEIAKKLQEMIASGEYK